MAKLKKDYHSLGEFLTTKRESIGISQKEVADRLDITPQMVCNWENGRCGPPNEKLEALAKILKISKNEFLENILASDEAFYRARLGLKPLKKSIKSQSN